MSTAPNFASLLDEAPTEIVRPKPLPVGTYVCSITGYEQGKSKKQGTPYVRFNLQPISALEDVDPLDLEASGGTEGKTLRLDFWITTDAIFRLDEFHTHAGIDITEPASRTMRNEAAINSTVLAVVSHRIDDNDPSRVYVDVTRTGSAD